MTDFPGLGLIDPILQAVEAEGYSTPTPIQAQSIPALLEGRDLLGIAQTGTGKTAAFSLPLLQRLAERRIHAKRRNPRALILAPTRELAVQIGDCLRTYGRHLRLKHAVVFGGAPIRAQIRQLSQGIDILVATPGRLLDLMGQGQARLDHVETFILDEADRMLDMGFVPDVRRISAAIPEKRQTVLFSATMPKAVQGLADGLLVDPVRVEVKPAATTAERVEQSVLFVAKDKKGALLGDLLDDRTLGRVLIFSRTKHGADRIARQLGRRGVPVDAIHGNKTQNARQRALKGFRSGKLRALVATDIAARGIDVDEVTHVINYDLPRDPESYVHRIGRTARGGSDGVALSFCDAEERAYLRDIERTIRQSVPVIDDHAYHLADIANDHANDRRAPGRGKGGASKGKGGNRRRRNGPPKGTAPKANGAGPKSTGPKSAGPKRSGGKPFSKGKRPANGNKRPDNRRNGGGDAPLRRKAG